MKHLFLKLTAIHIFVVVILLSAVSVQAQSQDKQARKLANRVAAAFSAGLEKLDSGHLLNGRLKLTMEYTGGDVEFEYKSFRTFAAMERYLKSQENDDGFPRRESGQKKLSCRKGLCELDLIEGQMRHHHVFLTKMYYGFSKGRIYVKRLYIVYG